MPPVTPSAHQRLEHPERLGRGTTGHGSVSLPISSYGATWARFTPDEPGRHPRALLPPQRDCRSADRAPLSADACPGQYEQPRPYPSRRESRTRPGRGLQTWCSPVARPRITMRRSIATAALESALCGTGTCVLPMLVATGKQVVFLWGLIRSSPAECRKPEAEAVGLCRSRSVQR
jgi:hypothetical protein